MYSPLNDPEGMKPSMIDMLSSYEAATLFLDAIGFLMISMVSCQWRRVKLCYRWKAYPLVKSGIKFRCRSGEWVELKAGG